MDLKGFALESQDILADIKRFFASHTDAAPRGVPYDKILNTMAFWPEFYPYFMDFKFAPFGSTSLDVPEFHKKNINKVVAESSVADYQYNQMSGRYDTRESIVKNFPEIKRFQEAGFQITSSNLYLSNGAIAGISSCIANLCKDVNDEVIIFEPMYPFHLGQVISKKLALKSIRMNYNPTANEFEIDYEGLRKALTPKSRVLILCNPNNPTTKVYTAEEYKKISEIIKDFPDLWVIEDSAYFLYHDDTHKPIPYPIVNPQDFNRTLTIYSGGKMYNVTGLRCGIIVGPAEFMGRLILTSVLESQLATVFEQSIIREDVVSANEVYRNGKDFYEETRQDIVQRGKRVAEELEKLGLKVAPVEGSYYLVAYLESLRGKIDEKYYKKLDEKEEETPELDKAFCRMLFSERKVGVMPMSQLYFGENIPDNLVRIAVNRNDEQLDLFISSCKDLIKL